MTGVQSFRSPVCYGDVALYLTRHFLFYGIIWEYPEPFFIGSKDIHTVTGSATGRLEVVCNNPYGSPLLCNSLHLMNDYIDSHRFFLVLTATNYEVGKPVVEQTSCENKAAWYCAGWREGIWKKAGHMMYHPSAVDFDTMSIFAIQEIAGLVCSFSDPRDQVRLMRTRQTVFYAALPFVWHAVNNAQNLFRLFPLVTVTTKGVDELVRLTYV
jgi:hypothetical protein